MSQYSNAQIRKLLTAVFKDEADFEILGDDYFEDLGSVPEKFANETNPKLKAQFLLKHAKQNSLLDKLLMLLYEADSDKYKELGFSPPSKPIGS